MAQVLLHGFGIAGFRSFDYGDIQRVGPMSSVHLVAGPNNAGKSNILSAAERFRPDPARGGGGTALEYVDLPSGSPLNNGPDAKPTMAIALPVDDGSFAAAASARASHVGNLARILAEALVESEATDENGYLWLEIAPELSQPLKLERWSISESQATLIVQSLSHKRADPPDVVRHLASGLARTSGHPGRDLAAILYSLFGEKLRFPPVQTIPPFRQITAHDERSTGSFMGDGLIRRLAKLQHPDQTDYSDAKQRFEAINAFVRDLLQDGDAHLEIPHGDQDLYLHHGGRMLPLASYGTGIHQTIILAVAASVLEDHLLCIEEPEIHLHPTMQRKLLAYLQANTTNQYLIATHSAAMLDAAKASITSVRLQDGYSKTAPAVSPNRIAELSAELGYRASDIVQSNAVIWVEGPSDRTYLRFWISELAPDLEEGKDYSIMFYGGSLLRHLDPEDPSVQEFISLPRLNRNFAVVIDSDKTGSHRHIARTKQAVKDAIASGPENRAVWVTKGYTIENYIPPELLAAAVTDVHSKAKCRWIGAQYENPLGKDNLDGREHADKAAIAARVVERWKTVPKEQREWRLDLKLQVRQLVNLVCAAND